MVGVEVPPVSADVSVGVGGMVLVKHYNILLIYLLNIHINVSFQHGIATTDCISCV